MRKKIITGVLAGALTLLSVKAALAKEKKDALYVSLGKKPAITAVVDEFVARVAADARINGFFKQTASDPARLAKFKMPKRVFIVDELPRNTMGKVQKNVLRDMYEDIYAKR